MTTNIATEQVSQRASILRLLAVATDLGLRSEGIYISADRVTVLAEPWDAIQWLDTFGTTFAGIDLHIALEPDEVLA